MAAGRPAAPPAAVTGQHLPGGGFSLDNGLLRVVIDDRGLVTSVTDLAAGREALAPGATANLLQLHPDLPNEWDAWDVDRFYRNTVTDLTDVAELELVKAGEPGAAATVRVTRAFGGSLVTQLITLRAGARRLDFETEVDWHEREKFLKVAFPVDVRADRSAAETQFGHVFRPTHCNTSWEAAKFEICAHRFLHVGETGWGAALVNDSTYGHDVTSAVRPDGGTTTTVRLSLLRAPRYPDPDTDQGVHTLRYAFVPGAGIADAVREGYLINLPPRRVRAAHGRVGPGPGGRGQPGGRDRSRQAGRRPVRRRGRPAVRIPGRAGQHPADHGLHHRHGHRDRPAGTPAARCRAAARHRRQHGRVVVPPVPDPHPPPDAIACRAGPAPSPPPRPSGCSRSCGGVSTSRCGCAGR